MTSKGPVGEALDVQRSRPSSVRFVAEKYDVEASADDLDFDKPAGPRHHPKPHIAPQRPNLKPAAVDVDQPPASKTAGKAGAGAGLHDSGVPTPAAMRAKFDEAFPAQVGPTRADFVDPKAKKKRSWVSKIVHKMGDPTGKQKHKNKDAKQVPQPATPAAQQAALSKLPDHLKTQSSSPSLTAAQAAQQSQSSAASRTGSTSRDAGRQAAGPTGIALVPGSAISKPGTSNQPQTIDTVVVSRHQSYSLPASSPHVAEPAALQASHIFGTPSPQTKINIATYNKSFKVAQEAKSTWAPHLPHFHIPGLGRHKHTESQDALVPRQASSSKANKSFTGQNQLKLYRRSNSSRAAEKPVGQPASAQPGSATPAQSREAAAAAACAANAEPAPDQQAQLIPASSNQPEPVSRRQSYTSAASSGNSGTNLMTAEPSCISLTQVASRTPSGQPAPRNPSILGRGTAASPTKAAAPPKVDNWLMQLFVQWQPRQRLLSDDPAAGGKGGKYQEGSYAEWSAKSADLIRAKSKSDSKTCLSPSRLASGLSGLARLGSQQASPDGIRASQDGRAGSDSGSARSSYMLPQMFDSGAKQERTRHGCLGCCAPKTRN